jgi:hypothetical protein
VTVVPANTIVGVLRGAEHLEDFCGLPGFTDPVARDDQEIAGL